MDNKIEYLKKQLEQAEKNGDKVLRKKIYRSLAELGVVVEETDLHQNTSVQFETHLVNFENENQIIKNKSDSAFQKKKKVARICILPGIIAMVAGFMLMFGLEEITFSPMLLLGGLAVFSYALIAGFGRGSNKKWGNLQVQRYDEFIKENIKDIDAYAKCMRVGSMVDADSFGSGYFIEIQSQKGSFYIDDYIYIGNTKYKILHIINRQNGQPITHFNDKNPSALVCVSRTKINIDFVPYVFKI